MRPSENGAAVTPLSGASKQGVGPFPPLQFSLKMPGGWQPCGVLAFIFFVCVTCAVYCASVPDPQLDRMPNTSPQYKSPYLTLRSLRCLNPTGEGSPRLLTSVVPTWGFQSSKTPRLCQEAQVWPWQFLGPLVGELGAQPLRLLFWRLRSVSRSCGLARWGVGRVAELSC